MDIGFPCQPEGLCWASVLAIQAHYGMEKHYDWLKNCTQQTIKISPEAQNGLRYKWSNTPGNKDILCQSLASGPQQNVVYKDQDCGVQCVCLGKLLYGLSSTRGQLFFFGSFFILNGHLLKHLRQGPSGDCHSKTKNSFAVSKDISVTIQHAIWYIAYFVTWVHWKGTKQSKPIFNMLLKQCFIEQ